MCVCRPVRTLVDSCAPAQTIVPGARSVQFPDPRRMHNCRMDSKSCVGVPTIDASAKVWVSDRNEVRYPRFTLPKPLVIRSQVRNAALLKKCQGSIVWGAVDYPDDCDRRCRVHKIVRTDDIECLARETSCADNHDVASLGRLSCAGKIHPRIPIRSWCRVAVETMNETVRQEVSSIRYSAGASAAAASSRRVSTSRTLSVISDGRTPAVTIDPVSNASGRSMKSRSVTAGKPSMLDSSLIVPLSESTSFA